MTPARFRNHGAAATVYARDRFWRCRCFDPVAREPGDPVSRPHHTPDTVTRLPGGPAAAPPNPLLALTGASDHEFSTLIRLENIEGNTRNVVRRDRAKMLRHRG